MECVSNRRAAAFFRANANAIFQRRDKNLPIPDIPIPMLGGFQDGLDSNFDEWIIAGNVQADFGDEIGHDQLAAEHILTLILALVLPMASNSTDGDARDFSFDQRFAHFVEFIGLDDGSDEFHWVLRKFLTANSYESNRSPQAEVTRP
jgi:hypothetical protein